MIHKFSLRKQLLRLYSETKLGANNNEKNNNFMSANKLSSTDSALTKVAECYRNCNMQFV